MIRTELQVPRRIKQIKTKQKILNKKEIPIKINKDCLRVKKKEQTKENKKRKKVIHQKVINKISE